MVRNASFLFAGDVNAHHEEWHEPFMTILPGRAPRDFAPSSGCEQMVTEPAQKIDGRVLDLVLTDVLDLVGVQVGLPVGTSDHTTVSRDVVLEKTIPQLVCKQEVYLKNSVKWELARGDVKVLNWSEISRPTYPVSSLNEAL